MEKQNAASCNEEKENLSAPRKACAAPAPAKVEYSLDATHGFVVIQGDHHTTLAMGTLTSFEIRFDKTPGWRRRAVSTT